MEAKLWFSGFLEVGAGDTPCEQLRGATQEVAQKMPPSSPGPDSMTYNLCVIVLGSTVDFFEGMIVATSSGDAFPTQVLHTHTRDIDVYGTYGRLRSCRPRHSRSESRCRSSTRRFLLQSCLASRRPSRRSQTPGCGRSCAAPR